MFQDSEIILREKNFSDFQTNLSPGNAMRFQRQKLPFTCNQRRQTLPVRIAWKRDWSSCVSLRCGSASRGQNFLSQKIFQLFSKQVFFMFQDSEIILREKILPTFRPILVPVTQHDSKDRNSPLHVIREGGLSLFGSHGKGIGARVSHCDAGVPVEGHGIPEAQSTGAGGRWGRASWGWTSLGQNPWGRTSWGRTSLGQNPWGKTSWGRRSVGQDVVGQNFVGQDVTGAKSLGQNVVGQEVSGAGRRGAELRGAGRHWGNIPGAVGQWGRRFWGRK